MIVLVGPDEIPFGIQRDLLCAQSPFFKDKFATEASENQIELITKLCETDTKVFGYFQNFIYTGAVYDKRSGSEIPEYVIFQNFY